MEGETNSETDTSRKLSSRNWKDRQEAYNMLGRQWSNGQTPSSATLQLLQNETNIPAMESAIDALLVVDDLKVEDVRKIFQNIGNPKTSIKTRMEALIAHIKDTDAIVEVLCELLESKSPKSIVGALSGICSVLERSKCKLEMIGDKITGVMGHADKNVRDEGVRLCLALYRQNGDALLSYLEGLKTIQLRELREEFKKCRTTAEETKVVPVHLSDELYTRMEDENWKVRLDAMVSLRNSIGSVECTNELTTALCRRVNDANNQVFLMTLEILCELKPKNADIIRGLVERLKDKKSCVANKIKDTLSCMEVKVDSSVLEFLKHKNPQVRYNLLDYSTRNLCSDRDFIRAVAKCVSDSANEVRSKATEVLCRVSEKYGSVVADAVDSTVLARIKVIEASRKTGRTAGKETAPAKTSRVSDGAIKDEVNEIKKNRDGLECFHLPSEKEKNEILASFSSRYPFFQERNWNIRLNGFRTNLASLESEPVIDLCMFFYAYKEANFHLNLCFLDLLMSRKEELKKAMNLVMAYSVEHITEIKCKSKINELFTVLKELDRKHAAAFIWNEILKNKSGKKFIALVSLMGVVGDKEDEEVKYVLGLNCCGIAEREAVNELGDKMASVGSEPVAKKLEPIEYRKEDNTDIDMPADAKETICKRKHSQATVDVLLKNVSKQRKKGIGRREDVFTPQFIKIMDEGPLHKVLDLFDTIDKVVVSDFIIDFLIQSEASEASINSILLSFISSRYILRETECRKLVLYLLQNEMDEELEMMDRVYPVTKLFLVYQRIGTKEANNEILRLVKKYKMFRGDKKMFIDGIKKDREGELEEIVRGCPDFLSFIDELEGSFMSTSAKDERVEDTPCATHRDTFVAKDSNIDFYPPHDIETVYVGNDSFNVDEVDVEASFDALSINSTLGVTTPNLKKFRKEFETPVKQKEVIDGLELILDHLIDSNPKVSEIAFKRLMNVMETNMDALLFSSNSILSSMSIQLFDFLHNPSFSLLIFDVFLKASQSRVFCEQLRKETLVSVNFDLIKIMKRQSKRTGYTCTSLPNAPSAHDASSLIGDILINLCLNSRPSVILEAYLEILEKSREEILLKLIWRHSKSLKMDDREEIAKVLDVLAHFYDNNYTSILAEDNITLKILQLHLKEIVRFYREGIHEFGIQGLAEVFVASLVDSAEITHSGAKG